MEGNVINSSLLSSNEDVGISDGSNGMIVFFKAQANDTSINTNIYAQHINALGQLQWGNVDHPSPVCVKFVVKRIEDVIPDGSGGAFIAWTEYPDDTESIDLYIQHLNSSGNATWVLNGIRINLNNTRKYYHAILCPDGSGGVIVAWDEMIFDTTTYLTTYSEVFAQRFNSAGAVQWGAGGVQVCTVAGFRRAGTIVSDGDGGAILSFTDSRNSNQLPDDSFDNLDLYAQKLNASGVLQWGSGGIPVNSDPGNQFNPDELQANRSSIPDGSGGMILIFTSASESDVSEPDNIYAQRINASGARQWVDAGVPVCTADNLEINTKLLSDGADGIVVFWGNATTAELGNSSYYGQRVLANGTVNWPVNGIRLIDSSSYFANICSDGSGNYIYTWISNELRVKIQKIDGSGAMLWQVGGKNVVTVSDDIADRPEIVQAEAGSAIINWVDYNLGVNKFYIYAAKITATGDLVNNAASTTYFTIADGNWNDPSIWSGGIVPGASTHCIITNHVTVTANAVCYSLTVQQSGNITVNTGVNFTVLH